MKISSSSSQVQIPVETVTVPELQSGQPNKNLVGGEPQGIPDLVHGSLGGQGQQGLRSTSVVGLQTPADWLQEGVNTQAPVSRPPPLLSDPPLPGKRTDSS